MIAFPFIAAISALLPHKDARVQARFDAYGPLSRNTEMMHRLLSPLTARLLLMRAKLAGQALREQSIDLADERFALHVPAKAPADGYALLVFVSPWPQANVPAAGVTALDRHDIILVGAERSGNDADRLDRREPLALLAAYNVMRKYPVDPHRVFIGGFSGGSRVALRLALGYPDLFRGALLMAGSDPIGTARIPLPPAPLFEQFRRSSRLVYLTGRQDADHLAMDERSRASLLDWCVAGATGAPAPWTGHELPPAGALDHALSMLLQPVSTDTPRLAACRTRLDRKLAARLRMVRQLADQRRSSEANTLLQSIDAHYGGLAAPQSVSLARRLRMPAHAATY